MNFIRWREKKRSDFMRNDKIMRFSFVCPRDFNMRAHTFTYSTNSSWNAKQTNRKVFVQFPLCHCQCTLCVCLCVHQRHALQSLNVLIRTKRTEKGKIDSTTMQQWANAENSKTGFFHAFYFVWFSRVSLPETESVLVTTRMCVNVFEAIA